jgi:hypothetical protein
VRDHLRFRCLKLEINKRHWTGRREQFERQKCANVCRDLNARRLQSQAINKLTVFLGNRQKQRNEKQHDRPTGQQEFASYMLETEQRTAASNVIRWSSP